ncbi:zinc-binding dehydrogenase [Streptomyces sp. 3MP-14]|uniref:Zinc-binding dehydrogenase n=1 Tax=Streptomyces mimosae TaxID=2586635 RepID=A0A5N6AQU0_9ACTN|nr:MULTISPECIES: NADP-dependent oxidoreductase [Streptomyces]KAB8171207.1 zinc-binding dehydrogenase [Streptomyces mimosae]KAB8179906.1 zinc-binding dehydrogenase [Streptomyces sp. 3MP-14]
MPSTLPTTGRAWHLVARPTGWPTDANFALRTAPVSEPGAGEILVRNRYLSVDPYMRGRMNAGRSYVAPFELDEPMLGDALGEVVASRADGVAVGDLVVHQLGWREFATLPAADAAVVPRDLGVPDTAFLGVLGMTGLTAYVGMKDIARVREGDVVFVSGAAGAVGGPAGQLARLLGASRVIGSAGGPEKARLLTEEFGFDAAIDYKAAPVGEQLAKAAPEGIDVYFDNVGGDHLEAALDALNVFGRVAVCGLISSYNATEPVPGPRNLGLVLGRRLRVEGFLVTDHQARRAEFLRQTAEWVRSGQLRYRETVFEGIERATEAFLAMMRGGNVGKMLVALEG